MFFRDLNQQINEQSHYVASLMFRAIRQELRRQIVTGEFQGDVYDWIPNITIGNTEMKASCDEQTNTK